MIRSARSPRRAAAILLLLLPGLAPELAMAAQRETIVFLRHGEKPPGGLGQLDCQGLNRALALPPVLISRYGKADFVFAPDPAEQVKDGGHLYDYVRPLATIEPTAIALGLPLETPVGFTDTDGLARRLLAERYRDALVFVAWEHVMLVRTVREIVRRTGGDPGAVPDWPDSDYDSIYVLAITREGEKTSVAFSHQQEGLNGQSTSCP